MHKRTHSNHLFECSLLCDCPLYKCLHTKRYPFKINHFAFTRLIHSLSHAWPDPPVRLFVHSLSLLAKFALTRNSLSCLKFLVIHFHAYAIHIIDVISISNNLKTFRSIKSENRFECECVCAVYLHTI